MTHVVQKSSPKRRGFSLVLSLTIMAMILLMVITLASFLSIEARLAAANQLRTQARMQALVSLRLALAHLQQEAGPDRRATFRADIMRLSYASFAASSPVSYSQTRNPMWTGVSRTDRPFVLPAWIISGRGDQRAGSQSVYLSTPLTESQSLTNPYWTNNGTYPSSYWKPWDTSYTGGLNSDKIILVGDATATIFEDENSLDPLSGRPDGRVSLPAVTLPDSNVAGRYCYWVGDEGVKANIALIDPRLENSGTYYSAGRGVGRTGVELLTGFSNYQPGDIDSRVRSTDQLKLLSSTIFSDSSGNNAKALWPDVTLVSRGLFTDNRWGGLQIDLSSLFEMEESDFNASEFGKGNGTVERPGGSLDERNEPNYTASERGLVTYGFEEGYTLSGIRQYAAFKNTKKTFNFNSTSETVTPIWSFRASDPTQYSYLHVPQNLQTSTDAEIRGPCWDALRNYHRLYKEVTSNSIKARPHYPNTVQLSNSGYPSIIGINHYSQMYNRSITPKLITSNSGSTYSRNIGNSSNNWLDFVGNDRIYTWGPRGNNFNTAINNNIPNGSFLAPIPTKVSVAPYIARQLIIIGICKGPDDSINAYLKITPITVLHNPYNVKLDINTAPHRISIRDMNQWWLEYIKTSPASSPATGTVTETWYNDQGILSLIKFDNKNSNANNDQSLVFDFPSKITLEPGEFRFFYPENTSDFRSNLSDNLSTNSREKGFYGPLLDNNKEPATPPQTGLISTPKKIPVNLGSGVSMTVRLWTDNYWPSGFKIIYQMKHPDYSMDGLNDSVWGINSYNNCSIVSELCSSPSGNGAYSFKPNVNGPAPIARPIDINLPTHSETPLILGVFDYSVRWPINDSSPWPIFARSNPMAASTRIDQNDYAWYSNTNSPAAPTPYIDSATFHYSSTSPSYKFEIYNASSAFELDTKINNAAINPNTFPAVFSEVPLTTPISIAQYTYANYGISDYDPLYQIGNSLASAFGPQGQWARKGPNDTPYSTTPSLNPLSTHNELSSYDASICINAALFDRYFLSSITPQNVTDFLNGSSLPNPRIKILSNLNIEKIKERLTNTESKKMSPKIFKPHRTAASVLCNEGAFNVHSTSVRAWAAVLGGAKVQNNSNALYQRAIRQENFNANGFSEPPYNNANAWSGLGSLSDKQIKLLAREIVKANYWKLSVAHRFENLSLAGGHTMVTDAGLTQSGSPGNLPMPYLGLAQFVNRTYCPHAAGSYNANCGVLHYAIAAADRAGAKLSNRINTAGDADVQLDLLGVSNTNYSKAPPPLVRGNSGSDNDLVGNRKYVRSIRYSSQPGNNIFLETKNYADVKIGSPTSLLPSDILAAIGNSLTTRSDTFTIRAYGDVSDKAGSPAAGTCWIEAVVQRIPDFVDDSQLPDIDVSNPTNGLAHNTQRILPVNAVLGRRFVVISVKLLKPNEL